jgi:hypothetical protein
VTAPKNGVTAPKNGVTTPKWDIPRLGAVFRAQDRRARLKMSVPCTQGLFLGNFETKSDLLAAGGAHVSRIAADRDETPG